MTVGIFFLAMKVLTFIFHFIICTFKLGGHKFLPYKYLPSVYLGIIS